MMSIFNCLFRVQGKNILKSPIVCPVKNDRPLCPSCGYDLEVIPKRKKKCPSCGQPIYIKGTPDNRTKRLMTEKQAKDAEEQWDLYNTRQSSISTVCLLGCDESDIEKERAHGAKNDHEAVRSIATRVSASSQDLHTLKMAFLILANCAAEAGKPFRHFIVEAHRCELRHYKLTGVVKKVEIVISKQRDICIECQSNNGKIYDIDEALQVMPLPCPKCTCVGVGGEVGFCGCYYLPMLPESG